jgi:hypothetical protein
MKSGLAGVAAASRRVGGVFWLAVRCETQLTTACSGTEVATRRSLGLQSVEAS